MRCKKRRLRIAVQHMLQRASSLPALALVTLSNSAANAERVWKICKGAVPELPSTEAMKEDVMVGVDAKCTQEYTFKEWCDVDLNALTDDLLEEGSLFLKAMNRESSSPDGSMAVSASCSPGSECYLLCTSGSSVVELAQESADPPSTGSASSAVSAPPEKVGASCSPDYYSEQEITDGVLFTYRQKFLMDAGVDSQSDSLVCPCVYPCPYSEKDARHMKPGEESTASFMSLSSDNSVRLRGVRKNSPEDMEHTSNEAASGKAKAGSAGGLGCNTTLAALAKMGASEVLVQFPHIGFFKPEPGARTMSRSGRAFKKLNIRRAMFDDVRQRLMLTSYVGQKLEIDAETAKVTLTNSATGKTDVLDGHGVCVFNVPREKQRETVEVEASLVQEKSGALRTAGSSATRRQGCTGSDCDEHTRFGGALITSGSFTMMAAGGA